MQGLFIQLSTLPPNYLPLLLSHLSLHPEITELAFSDGQSWNIPTVNRTCWLGSTWVPWQGPRPDTPSDLQPWMVQIAGVAGMQTPSYRWDQINLDLQLAQSLPQGWNWYVGQEVGIDALGDHPKLREGWEAYLIELCRRLHALRPGIKVLWSPYAWDAWASVSIPRRAKIAAALKTLVNNVRYYSNTPGLTRIDLQDGRGVQIEPASDAVNWWNLIKGCGTEVKINAELFAQGLTPLPAEELDARLNFYKAQGVPVGCCWEARYWLLPPAYVAIANHSEP